MFRVLAVSGGVVLVVGVLTSFCHPWMTLQGAFPGPLHQSVDIEAVEVCTVEDPELNEASGLAMSLQHKDAVWIHNDSGDTARLFLVGLDGKTRAVVHLNQHKPLDWEDMCSLEIDGQAWLLIGDIGDNSRTRGTTAVSAAAGEGTKISTRGWRCRRENSADGERGSPRDSAVQRSGRTGGLRKSGR